MVALFSGILMAFFAGIAKIIDSMVKHYFQGFEARMTALETAQKNSERAQQEYQLKMLENMAGMRELLVEMRTQRATYVTDTQLSDTVRRLETAITDSRHTLRGELQGMVSKIELGAGEAHQKLEDKILRWMDGCAARRHDWEEK